MTRLIPVLLCATLLVTVALGAPNARMQKRGSIGSKDDDCAPQSNCRKFCENGFQTDQDGCHTCECNVCPPVCYIYCDNGNVQDENGCDLCQCNPPADDEQKK